ncbi:MAG: RNA-binding domain-containing protein [Planctomycetota bacterium]
MTTAEFEAKLAELKALPNETEWVEFKQNDHGPAKYPEIGEYLSAIANSLPLVRRDKGYIVWGIHDVTRDAIGTDFKPRQAKYGNEELEHWLTRGLSPQIPFTIHEETLGARCFVIFEVGAATRVPVSFNQIEYVRVGSLKKRLRDYPEKARELWRLLSDGLHVDWSAQTCDGATLNDLDPDALTFARKEYKEKNSKLAQEVDRWDNATFLNKVKLSLDGKLTRAAILLLGKNEAERWLSPAIAQITWTLKDAKRNTVDYAHFGAPLILAVNQVYAKIRNLTYRHIDNGGLFPTELLQYDPWVIRESLHNCIAHQDYTQNCRINVVEIPDELLFTNAGDFLPGTVERAIRSDSPPEYYRNRLLTQAMVNLNMIDTIGSGIKRVFETQRQRHFPMPDYELDEPQRVKVRITGKVIDEKFTHLLISKTDLSLMDVIALDKVQKGRSLSDDEFKSLKAKRLVEGRRPNLYIAAKIAVATDTRADYIRLRAFDKDHYKKMVVEFLKKFGTISRSDAHKLLFKNLSDALTEKQKIDVIKNLLQDMRHQGTIRPTGAPRGRGAKWELSNAD